MSPFRGSPPGRETRPQMATAMLVVCLASVAYGRVALQPEEAVPAQPASAFLRAERHTGSKSFDSWLASHLCACERAGCAHVARSGFLRHRHWCAVARFGAIH